MSVRSLAARVVHAADHAAGRVGGRRRVLIEARTPMNLVVLEPIWKQLIADKRLAVEFTAEEPTVIPILQARGLTRIGRDPARWRRYDLAINADPWNAAVLRRCRRRINVFHGVAGKYDLDSPGKLPVDFSLYDRMLFANEDRRRRYIEAGVVSAERAVLTGFPRMDSLVRGEWRRDEVRAGFGLPDRPTVLYAPTFSPASSLQQAGESIVEALLGAGVNVIAKLHDRSMVAHPKYTDGVDWPARMERFARRPGFLLARDADVAPCFAAADVLVTDHSTVGFEFALLDRPVVVFDAPQLKEAARIDPGKWDLLRSMADVVATPAALVEAVRDALAHPERLREARRQAHTLFAHAGSATERALDAVYRELDLAAASVTRMPTWSESAASPAGDIPNRLIAAGRNPRTHT
jgi:hypothetical protein